MLVFDRQSNGCVWRWPHESDSIVYLSRGVAEPVQHRGNLVIAVANGHALNDFQRLHRGRGFGCRTRPIHRELRMRTSLPVNYQLKGLFILVSTHYDLFDGGSEDHLFE